jgi:hypothetical protein
MTDFDEDKSYVFLPSELERSSEHFEEATEETTTGNQDHFKGFLVHGFRLSVSTSFKTSLKK